MVFILFLSLTNCTIRFGRGSFVESLKLVSLDDSMVNWASLRFNSISLFYINSKFQNVSI